MDVILWGGKNGRTPYETALLEAILDATADTYPPYKLSVNNGHLGAERGRKIVAEGRQANVYVSGMREDHLTESGEILLINAPTMKGLFGYRAAIIRRGDQGRFDHSVEQTGLRDLVIGQGNKWEDAAILRHNHFNVNDYGRYENLLHMLAYGRFDAVLLGVAEVERELQASEYKDELAIADKTLVYYPHAMIFQVSGAKPQLAERIAKGLALVTQNGTLDQLLAEHFGSALALIRASSTELIVLEHPRPTLLPELSQPLLANKLLPSGESAPGL